MSKKVSTLSGKLYSAKPAQAAKYLLKKTKDVDISIAPCVGLIFAGFVNNHIKHISRSNAVANCLNYHITA